MREMICSPTAQSILPSEIGAEVPCLCRTSPSIYRPLLSSLPLPSGLSALDKYVPVALTSQCFLAQSLACFYISLMRATKALGLCMGLKDSFHWMISYLFTHIRINYIFTTIQQFWFLCQECYLELTFKNVCFNYGLGAWKSSWLLLLSRFFKSSYFIVSQKWLHIPWTFQPI